MTLIAKSFESTILNVFKGLQENMPKAQKEQCLTK